MKTITHGLAALLLGSACMAEAANGAATNAPAAVPAKAVRPVAPADMRTKVRTLVLPDLNFRDAPLSEIAAFIVDQSRAADPEGVGVSIIIKDDARGSLGRRRLTLGIKRPTLEHAFRLLSSAAGILIRIDRSVIVIENDTDVTGPAVRR